MSCRHYRYEQKLACLLWKVDFREITIIPTQSVHLSTCATVSNKRIPSGLQLRALEISTAILFIATRYVEKSLCKLL